MRSVLFIAIVLALACGGGCEAEREPSPVDPDETTTPHDPYGQ